jgi:pyrroline-5-carboxylate reductase
MSPEKKIAKNLNQYPFGEKISQEHIDYCLENDLLIVTQTYNDVIQLSGTINKSYYSDEKILLGSKGDTIEIAVKPNGFDEFDSVIKKFYTTDSVSVPNTIIGVINYITFNDLNQNFKSDIPYEVFYLSDEEHKKQGIVINLNNIKKWL